MYGTSTRCRSNSQYRTARVSTIYAGLLFVAALAGCTAPPADDAAARQASPAELHRSGQLIFAGQVTPDQLHELQATGLGTVINCRTQAEMDSLEFDEPELLDQLDMQYVHLPLGGADGYSPEAVDAFAAELQRLEGVVLIHCSGGGRVRALYAAYLVRYEGLTVEEARERLRELGQGPSALERLLGERLRYELTGEPLPPDDDPPA
jgi:uncharacterized protein (TIGR01244 family)